MANLEKKRNVLDSYIYKPDKPIFSSANYQVYEAKQKETKLLVTIKIIKGASQDLLRYLKKLKDCKSENTIRIYELIEDGSSVVMISEYVSHGNLSNALAKCKRLDEPDAIFVSKMLLNGYVDLLRLDCTWVGSQRDIEFTESGIKLSWNNFTALKSQNCLSKVLFSISHRQDNQSSILLFPKSKVMEQLINVSKQSASEISLNPNLKKKQKGIRKKSKDWMALRQINSKNQYVEESAFFAVDLQNGFVRVKIYQKGSISQQLLALSKSKPNFIKVLECYQENSKTIIISEYSNDGSLQNYITKLKSSKIKLTEDQIQFFFYSLMEPLKQIQETALKSIGMLHIKNIYLENGIVKIGEPVPMNQKLLATLRERQDVPDFYHPGFKKDPASKSDTYDTYSLGVLLYKLMYTEYPIFPQGKVHIPTAPNYNKRIKTTLEVLLNQGGNLKSLQSKIQVSEAVKKQVKQNKAILDVISIKDQRKVSVELSKRALVEDMEETQDHVDHKSQEKSDFVEEYEDEHGCCSLFCHTLEFTGHEEATNRFVRVTGLQQSPYRIYRVCTKIILIVLLYSLVFYYFFLQSNFNFLGKQSELKVFNVTIATVNYPIVIASQQTFETQFNRSGRNLGSLQSMNCLIDGLNGNPIYSDLIVSKSSGWIFFLVASLLSYILFMVIKTWMCYGYDLVRAVYNWDHGKYNFNISNFIVFNLLFCCLLNGHFSLFNMIFDGQLQPCVGSQYYYSSTYTLFNDVNKVLISLLQFLFPYMTTYILQLAVVVVHWIALWRTHLVPYNKLVNPIIIFCPLLVTQWIVLRIGVVTGFFVPNALQGNQAIKGYFTDLKYTEMLGIVPEILWIGELIIGLIVDSIYWCFLDKRRRLLIHDSSAASMTEMIK